MMEPTTERATEQTLEAAVKSTIIVGHIRFETDRAIITEFHSSQLATGEEIDFILEQCEEDGLEAIVVEAYWGKIDYELPTTRNEAIHADVTPEFDAFNNK